MENSLVALKEYLEVCLLQDDAMKSENIKNEESYGLFQDWQRYFSEVIIQMHLTPKTRHPI